MGDISVTTSVSRVELVRPGGAEGEAGARERGPVDVTVSVTNAGHPRRLVLAAYGGDAVQDGAAQGDPGSWATIERPVRDVAAGATEQYTVRFSGESASPGTYDVKLVAYPADRAPEEYADGAAVVHVQVPDGAPQPAKRKLPWWLIPLGAMLLLVAIGVVLFLVRPTTVAVPEVVGQPRADAEAAVADAGLEVEVETQLGPEPVGVVLAQDPPGGTEVEAGAVVRITVRTGVLLPDVVGLGLEQARVRLGEDVQVTTVVKEDPEPAGTVLDMAPAAGTEVGQGSIVRLIVATERTTVVPPLAGRNISSARGELASLGLESRVVEGALCRALFIETCIVVGQRPDSGTRVPLGTVITLFTT